MLVAGTEGGGGAGDVVPFVLTQDVVNDNNDDDYEHSLQRPLWIFFVSLQQTSGNDYTSKRQLLCNIDHEIFQKYV